MIVHPYASKADLDRISDIARRRGIVLIEDCAQSPGAKWGGKRAGATGAIGAFSFHQGKPLTTGEGGMVVTSDEQLACRLEHIRAERVRSVLQECSRYFVAAGNGMNLPELRALLDRTLD
jgi:L-glutamine:2-deoxy-scyllo-inosose/3-amino-2,3-dideoxy-scyllo-inosose aminotransferase